MDKGTTDLLTVGWYIVLFSILSAGLLIPVFLVYSWYNNRRFFINKFYLCQYSFGGQFQYSVFDHKTKMVYQSSEIIKDFEVINQDENKEKMIDRLNRINQA